jgi:hypothetical protein
MEDVFFLYPYPISNNTAQQRTATLLQYVLCVCIYIYIYMCVCVCVYKTHTHTHTYILRGRILPFVLLFHILSILHVTDKVFNKF